MGLYARSVLLSTASAVTPKNPVLPTHHLWVNALVVFVLLSSVIVGLVLLCRRRSRAATVTAGAEALLAERFARGEIDQPEYEHRREALRS
jgi:putative membrane protein